MKLRYIAVLGGLLAGGIIGLVPVQPSAAPPAKPAKLAISERRVPHCCAWARPCAR